MLMILVECLSNRMSLWGRSSMGFGTCTGARHVLEPSPDSASTLGFYALAQSSWWLIGHLQTLAHRLESPLGRVNMEPPSLTLYQSFPWAWRCYCRYAIVLRHWMDSRGVQYFKSIIGTLSGSNTQNKSNVSKHLSFLAKRSYSNQHFVYNREVVPISLLPAHDSYRI